MNDASEKVRLAVICSHPIQYYVPWFRELAAREEIVLHVFYLWDAGIKSFHDPGFDKTIDWQVDLTGGYEWTLTPNLAPRPGTDRFLGLINPGLLRDLRRFSPDAVLLFGYKYATHLGLILRTRFSRLPLIFRGDSHLLGSKSRVPHAKRFALRLLFSRFSALLYAGRANKEYFHRFGVPERKLFFAPHAIDPSLFDPDDPRYAENARRTRADLAIPKDSRVILYCGKFVPAKQPGLLLSAFRKTDLANAILVFAGAGPEEAALREQARDLPNVRFLPFASQREMPTRYLMADLFVLPSRSETWGLAVQEALTMGIPCMTSDVVGCHPDLIDDGKTGWTFPASDEHELTARLREAMSAIEKHADEMARAARRKAGLYSSARTTRGLLDALRLVQTTPNRR